jgi:hypothetical protein
MRTDDAVYAGADELLEFYLDDIALWRYAAIVENPNEF